MTDGLSNGWEPTSCHGQYGVVFCSTLVGRKEQMAQEDSLCLAVFFINPSFDSMGRSSMTNLQTSPLATPHLSCLLFLSIHSLSHCFHICSYRHIHLFNRFGQLTIYLTVLVFLTIFSCLYVPPLSISPSFSQPPSPALYYPFQSSHVPMWIWFLWAAGLIAVTQAVC